jgi:hypothetical protein
MHRSAATSCQRLSPDPRTDSRKTMAENRHATGSAMQRAAVAVAEVTALFGQSAAKPMMMASRKAKRRSVAWLLELRVVAPVGCNKFIIPE